MYSSSIQLHVFKNICCLTYLQQSVITFCLRLVCTIFIIFARRHVIHTVVIGILTVIVLCAAKYNYAVIYRQMFCRDTASSMVLLMCVHV